MTDWIRLHKEGNLAINANVLDFRSEAIYAAKYHQVFY